MRVLSTLMLSTRTSTYVSSGTSTEIRYSSTTSMSTKYSGPNPAKRVQLISDLNTHYWLMHSPRLSTFFHLMPFLILPHSTLATHAGLHGVSQHGIPHECMPLPLFNAPDDGNCVWEFPKPPYTCGSHPLRVTPLFVNILSQATVLDARASRVKWPAQVMSHWYGILFTE